MQFRRVAPRMSLTPSPADFPNNTTFLQAVPMGRIGQTGVPISASCQKSFSSAHHGLQHHPANHIGHTDTASGERCRGSEVLLYLYPELTSVTPWTASYTPTLSHGLRRERGVPTRVSHLSLPPASSRSTLQLIGQTDTVA